MGSLKRDRQQKAERKTKGGQGLGATDNVFVFFSNRLGCAGSPLVTVVLSLLLFLLMRRYSIRAGQGVMCATSSPLCPLCRCLHRRAPKLDSLCHLTRCARTRHFAHTQ
jgi:hypothetical protein